MTLLLYYDIVNEKFADSQSYLKYASNQLELSDSCIASWSELVTNRNYTMNKSYLSIRYNNNMNQQQINDSFNMKLQHIMDGQQKIMDAQQSVSSTVTKNIMDSIIAMSMNSSSSSDMPPPAKRQRQMLLTPVVFNSSRLAASPIAMPSPKVSTDIELDLKHVHIQSAIVDYYGKQQFNCIASVDSANAKSSTKSTLIKLRRLINAIHYLAKDDAHVLTWCKTAPTQRTADWAARMTSKSIDLQDIVINTLKEIGCKQNNKAPYFWSTYKMFESNKLFVHSDNYYN